ncbi:MAG: DNA cytosine methyltransferase [Oscillospiraceae bacterium]|nr:DNA cytosine methyltransferase [Oscillospiraceae bacterium]
MIGHLDIKEHDAIKRVYSPEGIAPTLTTCGGYREVKILDLSKFRVRKLTPTEYGRLQAFPMQDWEQVVSDSQAYKQFGNAVTVSVVTAIAQKLGECLNATAINLRRDLGGMDDAQ